MLNVNITIISLFSVFIVTVYFSIRLARLQKASHYFDLMYSKYM